MTKRTPINQGVALDERETRGLDKAQMADILGLDGLNADQVLLDIETGFRKPKGAVLRIYESLNRQRWSAESLLEVPVWTVSVGDQVIHHNAWPRFVGRALVPELHPQQWQFKKAGMPAFAMDERCGFRQLVVVWIDHVPDSFDAEDIVMEGLRMLEQALMESKNNGLQKL
jgi:hypothetical protein